MHEVILFVLQNPYLDKGTQLVPSFNILHMQLNAEFNPGSWHPAIVLIDMLVCHVNIIELPCPPYPSMLLFIFYSFWKEYRWDICPGAVLIKVYLIWFWFHSRLLWLSQTHREGPCPGSMWRWTCFIGWHSLPSVPPAEGPAPSELGSWLLLVFTERTELV